MAPVGLAEALQQRTTEWSVRFEQLTYPRGLPKVVVVMNIAIDLQAFMDESGGSGCCLVGGYMGTTTRWAEFEDRWCAALDAANIDDFHAKDFFAFDDCGHRHKTYRHLCPNERITLLNGLLAAISKTDIHPAAEVVDLAAFAALTIDEQRFLTGGRFVTRRRTWDIQGKPSEPVILAFEKVWMSFLGRAKHGTRLHIVHDRNNVIGPFVTEMYGAAAERWKDKPIGQRMGSIQFESRLIAIPLQAADLLAHCWHSWQIEREAMHQELHHCMAVLTRRLPSIKIWDERGLKYLLDTGLPSRVRDGSLVKQPKKLQYRHHR